MFSIWKSLKYVIFVKLLCMKKLADLGEQDEGSEKELKQICVLVASLRERERWESLLFLTKTEKNV